MKAVGYKLLLKYILLVVMSFTLPKAAAADMPVVYMDEGRALFSFDVPDFWQVRSGGQRSVTPPDADEARLITGSSGCGPPRMMGLGWDLSHLTGCGLMMRRSNISAISGPLLSRTPRHSHPGVCPSVGARRQAFQARDAERVGQ